MNGTRTLKGTVVYFVSSTMNYPAFGDNPGLYPWSVYCVDLESKVDSSTFLQPKVRICDASFEIPAFCIFESTLYVFQGRIHRCEGQSIYSYTLKPEDSGLDLSKSMMMKVGEMNNIKYSPMAVVTPNGRRIIVYSLLTNLDFEIFNPIDGKCEKLPQINCGERSLISSCAFVSKYVLLVHTMMRDGLQQSFTLDLKDPHHWKECLKPTLKHHSLIFAENICLTPNAGYFISEDEVADDFDEFRMGWYPYPEISSQPEDEDFRSIFSDITLIEDEDEYGSCEFCILDLALEKREEKTDEWEWPMYTPHITLDVYRCDLNVCRKEMKRMNDLKMGAEYSGDNEWRRWQADFMLPGATKRKSLKLCLQPQMCDHLNTLSFSSYNGCA